MTVAIDNIKEIYPPAREKTDEYIQPFLDTALLVVNEQLRPKCLMSEDRYDRITVYLTAHFMSLTSDAEYSPSGASGALKRSKLGEADESYATPSDTEYGYGSSRWGQMAIALDTCGILAGVTTNKGVKALFRVVGSVKQPGWPTD